MSCSCLVIGGSGFLGGHLVSTLVGRNYKVRATYNSNPKGKISPSPNVEYMKVDICNYEEINNACNNVDYIFLSTNINPYILSKHEYEKKIFQINTDGIKNVVRGMMENKARKIIFLSSVAAMGSKAGVETYDEDSLFELADAYGKSKLAGERILLDCYQKGDINASILRPSAFYANGSLGPLQKIVNFINRGIVPIIGKGENLQSLTYVGNVVNAAIALAENVKSSGRTYIITDERPYTVNEIIMTVGKELGEKYRVIHIPIFFLRSVASVFDYTTKISNRQMPISVSSVEAIVQNRVFKTDKIKSELGFHFAFDLASGVRRTLNLGIT